MTKYSVKQLSQLAGVSIRTLHHYDRIGLLKPAERSESRYRYYGREELLKLQQILFYKELDFPLKEIREIFENPDFDLLTALQFHQDQLKKRAGRIERLLTTIQKTIHQLKNQHDMMTDRELYEGFDQDKVEDMRNEVVQRWGEKSLLETEHKLRSLGKDGFKALKAQGEAVNRRLADLMDQAPHDVRVQQAVADHHEVLNQYYQVSEERYRCLGQMYTEDERFRAYYDQYREGLADFLLKAITVYCDNGMSVNPEVG